MIGALNVFSDVVLTRISGYLPKREFILGGFIYASHRYCGAFMSAAKCRSGVGHLLVCMNES